MSGSVGRSMAGGVALSLAKLITGVVRVKLTALALGAAGLGIYSIISQTYLTAVGITTLSLAVPIINLGRPRLVAGDHGEAGAIAGTALAIIVANWTVLAISGAMLGGALLAGLGVPPNLGVPLWPLIVAILLGALSAGFWEGVVFLSSRFDVYVRVGIIVSVMEMLFIGTGAWFGGLHGAIYAMPAGPLVGLAVYLILLRHDGDVRVLMKSLVVRINQVGPLAAYSVLMFCTATLTNVGFTFLRSRVLLETGAETNGHLQSVTAISAYVLAFVMTGFWGHIHARAAASGDTAEIREELDRTLRLGLLIAFTGCGIAAVLADFLVPLFYSSDFRAAVPMMTAYMPGELCFQLFSMLVAYQLTVSRRRAYLVLNLGYGGLLVAAGLMLIPGLDGFGYVVAHNLAAFTMLAVAVFQARASGQISSQLVVRTAMFILLLSLICAGTLYARFEGQLSFGLAALSLVPFMASGLIALRQLFMGFEVKLTAATSTEMPPTTQP